jgi:peptidoglycan/xylan/chitin deacetylase (PgdA/CDA1 family)
VRSLFLRLLNRSGGLRLWRWLRRHRIVILTAHGVMDAEDDPPWVPLRPQLSRRRLDDCLRILSRYYRFVSLEEAVAMLAGRAPVRPYSLVLTFDDGYRNHLTHALPILRRHGVPATFFLATGHIDHRRPFWFDRLDYALQHLPAGAHELPVGPRTIGIDARDRAALRASYKRLRDEGKALVRHDTEMLREMETLAEVLEARSGRRLADLLETDDWTAIATWDEIRAAAGDDVSFGSHTVDHVRLSFVDAETMEDQLRRSKRTIEAETGRPCRYFCYPNGSFDGRAAETTRACGYDAAVTTEEGTNRPGTDLMTLRRVDLAPDGDLTRLLLDVSGLSDALGGIAARPSAALASALAGALAAPGWLRGLARLAPGRLRGLPRTAAGWLRRLPRTDPARTPRRSTEWP